MWLLSQVRARSRDKDLLQMLCELTHANPASALLREGQGTGEGNACCLESDQGTGNSLIWHLATLLLSFSIQHQQYPLRRLFTSNLPVSWDDSAKACHVCSAFPCRAATGAEEL